MTYKMRNGQLVELTMQEIAALAARDADWSAGQQQRQAKRDRLDGLRADGPAQDMADRLVNATAAQIDAWFAANVNNAAQAIAVLKTICKIMASRW